MSSFRLGSLVSRSSVRGLFTSYRRIPRRFHSSCLQHRDTNESRTALGAVKFNFRRENSIKNYTTSSQTEESAAPEDNDDPIVKNSEEKVVGTLEKHEFQAQTAELLDIVAKSLYSENEIFIRELVSNSSDALEKLRHRQLTGAGNDVIDDGALEINIFCDKHNNTITIQDSGIGMSEEELLANLGTIARSGSKEFLKALTDNGQESGSIIGQFGVGFYSTFMVGSKVTVYSKSHEPGSTGYMWCSEGGVTYEVAEADDVAPGTKVIVSLKPDCRKFAVEEMVSDIIKKYSNFVSFPIKLNGKQINTVQPLWTLEPSQVDDDKHLQFYRYLSGSESDHFLYKLFYKTDAPLNIRSIFYVSETRQSLMDMSKEVASGVSLYSRRVLIQNKTEHLIPKWLRFVRGVVDSEDIPLNLSRELLQNSSLISKIRETLTNRLIRFFVDQSKKDAVKYMQFHTNYKMFITEGVLSEDTQDKKEEVAQLLRYETSNLPEGEMTSFDDYIKRMPEDQRNIYYLCVPTRQLAETSPYLEAMKNKNYEVVFCYDPYDEITMLQLRNYSQKQLFSVENEITANMFKEESEKKEEGTPVDGTSTLSPSQASGLVDWAKKTLDFKVSDVKTTTKLDKHPAMVTVWEMGSVRHYLRSQYLTNPKGLSETERSALFKPILQLNANHPVVTKLEILRQTDEELGKLILDQLYDNAMVSAGLIDDARPMVNRLNELLTRVLEKN